MRCTINVIHLNYPETIPPSVEKLPFMKLIPGAKKVGDLKDSPPTLWLPELINSFFA